MTAGLRSILWTGSDLLRDLGIAPSALDGKRPAMVESVEVDAFRCGPGALYVPRTREFDLPDPDQPAEIGQAMFRGAAMALTDEDITGFPPHMPILRVPDRRAALMRLAECGRARLAGPMVAITGSIGKTTTKDMLGQALSFMGPTVRGWRNYNGINGIPATLASIPRGCAHGVVEVAATHPDTVDYKLDHIRPDLAILTTITQAHLGNYPTRYDIFREKSKLLGALPRGASALVGQVAVEMDAAGDRLLQKMGITTMPVGTGTGNFVRLCGFDIGNRSTRAEIALGDQRFNVEIPQSGAGYAWGAAFTLGAFALLGYDPADAIPGIAAFQHPMTQRGTRWRINMGGSGRFVELIDDAQNSSPDTMRAQLAYLAHRTPRRKILVMGDMLELGDDAERMHRALARTVTEAGIDLLVAIGPLAGSLAGELAGSIESVICEDHEDAAGTLRPRLADGDLVLVKGAGKMGLGRVRTLLAAPRFQLPIRSDWLIEDGVLPGTVLSGGAPA